MGLGATPVIAPSITSGATTTMACGAMPIFTGGCSSTDQWVPANCGAVLGPNGVSLGICQPIQSSSCFKLFGNMESCIGPVGSLTLLAGLGILALIMVSK